jgi:very-short-patch-repair endonuclease
MGSVRRVDPWNHRQRPALLRLIRLTESPAEALLLPALLAHGGPEAHVIGPAGHWTLEAQVSVQTRGRAYRVDFAATWGDRKVAIEVDGWAHHHATEDQECYDATRDWAMGNVGWVVIRLDAYRVFKDPMGCAAEVAEQLHQVDIQARTVAKTPVEHQTEEEFAALVLEWEGYIAECEKNGYPEGAAENRRKLDRMKMARSKAKAVRDMVKAAGSSEGENEILRKLFSERARQKGLE